MDSLFQVSQTARLVVEADPDPQFPLRVLQRFSERGLLPSSFLAEVVGDGESLRIEVEFSGTIDSARLLAKRLLNLPAARNVDLSFRRMAATGLQRRAA